MGYNNGNIVGNVNENGVCSNFNGDDHCANDETPILLKDVECAGAEMKLKDCPGSGDTDSCSHE